MKKALFAALLALLAAQSAWATLITYDYTGELASGSLTLDSALLPGGSVSNLDYSEAFVDDSSLGPGMAIVDFAFSSPFLDVTCLAVCSFQFTTDGIGNMQTWDLEFLTGPSPLDLFITHNGDSIIGLDEFHDAFQSSGPGTWSSAQVAEPGMLLLLGLSLVGMLGWRRQARVT